MTEVAEHSGRYGQGPREFIELAALPSRLAALIEGAPLLFLGLGIVVFVAAGASISCFRQGWRSGPALTAWQGLLLSCVLAGQLILAVKHFGIHYVVPALSIVPSVLVWALHHVNLGSRSRMIVRTGTLLVVLGLSVGSVSITLRDMEVAQVRRNNQLAILQAELARHPAAVVVGAYRVPDRNYAIQFALGYLQRPYRLRLASKHPEFVSYNRFNHRLYRQLMAADLTSLNDIVAGGREVLRLLPPDLTLPGVEGELLVDVPEKARLMRVLHVGKIGGAP